MTYTLGIDLGTTYTAAAVHRDGRTSIVDLGTRTSVIPSIVFLTEEQDMLVGEAAGRRGPTDPGRLAREFKRRVGDTVPILLGGVPLSADALMARVLRWVVDTVAAAEGGPAAGIGVTHPANWGAFKQDLLHQAITRADLTGAVLLTEPEAAVIHYASQSRVDPGTVVAVYDLGGGTFDAAIVRKTADGVELLGTPEGIERLGGIDFDEAVFAHVATAVGPALQALDQDDPVAIAALARLRAECVEAKEALSADTTVTIPVILPNVSTSVRLTREEFEAMVRPALRDTLGAMHRVLRSAGLGPDDLSAVLLVGGSSRIPLVAEIVGELGRPIAVDAHPKHGVAMGAAMATAEQLGDLPAVAPPPAAGPAAAPESAPGLGPERATVPSPEPTPEPGPASAPATGPAPDPAADPATRPGPAPELAPARAAGSAPAVETAAASEPASAPASATGPGPKPAPEPEPASTPASRRRRPWPWLAGAAALIVAAVAAIALAGGDGGGGDGDELGAGDSASTTAAEPTTTAPPATDGPCAGVEGRCSHIDAIRLEGDLYKIEWTAHGFEPAIADGEFHVHLFWDNVAPEQAGVNADEPGVWDLTADQPYRTEPVDVSVLDPADERRGDSDSICITVANDRHETDDPTRFHCFAVPDA